MTADDVRQELHRILDAHGQLLTLLRAGNETLQQVHRSMQETFAAHDAVLISAIEANRAALTLLKRIQDEGVGA